MKKFEITDDIEIIKELLGINTTELSIQIGVDPSTIYRWKKNEESISCANLEAVYNFAFNRGIRLNKIKEQLFREECKKENVILFHGAKTYIDGDLSIEKSKDTNDFGKGFYCGESLEQSAMFVSNYPNSSLYIAEFDKTNLKGVQLGVNRDWMLMIAYFRNRLNEYSEHPIIKELFSLLDDVDYIVAPIADNRMFEIIDSFIDGEITDIQCQHCLSATNLGNQYVFVTQKALSQVKILRHCYLCEAEKQSYISVRYEDSRVSNDKVKIARKQYRGQGKYIEEILE